MHCNHKPAHWQGTPLLKVTTCTAEQGDTRPRDQSRRQVICLHLICWIDTTAAAVLVPFRCASCSTPKCWPAIWTEAWLTYTVSWEKEETGKEESYFRRELKCKRENWSTEIRSVERKEAWAETEWRDQGVASTEVKFWAWWRASSGAGKGQLYVRVCCENHLQGRCEPGCVSWSSVVRATAASLHWPAAAQQPCRPRIVTLLEYVTESAIK